MTRRGAAFAVVVLFVVALPVAAADPPLPPQRPDPEQQVPADDPVAVEPAAPEAPSAADSVASDLAEVPPAPPLYERLAESDNDFAACTAALSDLGAKFTPVEPITDQKFRDCGIARPVKLHEAVPGVSMQPDTVLRCAAALALAEWVSDFVLPAARRLPERGVVTAVAHGSSYICRRRNNAAEGKLSEHGFGNGIDVTGFRFADGSLLPIEPREADGTLDEAFQSAVRKTACLSFTTVLGPGTDAAHADHFHLDIKQRRGGFRLCQ